MSVITKLIPRTIKEKLRRKFTVHTNIRPYEIRLVSEGRLKGRTAVVTGGSGAIGRAVCFRLAAEGAVVYVSGRSPEKVAGVVNEIRGHKGLEAYPFVLDVQDAEAIAKTFADTFAGKKLDILVNCAGGDSGMISTVPHKLLQEQSVQVIDDILNTNLRGAILCTREAVRYMPEGGRIILISSSAAIGGKAASSEYSAAKSGLFGFLKSMAIELGARGINVNCVSPGMIARGEFSEETAERVWRKANYLHKAGTLEDVANAIFFLVSDESSFITGENITVDGGRTLGLCGNVG